MTKTRKYKKNSKRYKLIRHTTKVPKSNYINLKEKSYSPSVNKKINIKKTDDNVIDLFSCKKTLPKKMSYHFTKKKLKKIDAKFLSKLKKFIYGIEINVDLKKTICNNLSTKSALNAMLHNIYHQQPLIIKNITPPKQILSNCWFNTFFVIFFISDKGRKFFKHFRELMVTGKTINNKLIEPSLRASLILLNYSIEASYNYFGNSGGIAKKMDTNYLINFIFNSIHKNIYKHERTWLGNVNEAGNPLRYYNIIIDYLDSSIINILKIEPFINNKIDTEYIQSKLNQIDKPPHIIVIEIMEDYVYDKDETYILNLKSGRVIYKLDSIVIRTTNGDHFAATITCNEKELVFDGAGKNRLAYMNWKSKINNNEDWTIPSKFHSASDNINWNFKNGYQMMFYYRV